MHFYWYLCNLLDYLTRFIIKERRSLGNSEDFYHQIPTENFNPGVNFRQNLKLFLRSR